MKHSAPYARIAGTLAVLAVMQFPAVVRADGFTKDQLGAVAKPADDQNRSPWIRRMAGSSLELSSYVGSGTFYASGYHDSYVSTAVYARPTFDLGTRFQLSLNGRLYVEEELTKSALPNGRGFNPYDIWLWLSAKELHRFQTSKIRLGGTLRLVVPLSYESRYAHMVTGLAGGLNVTRTFQMGNDPTPEKNWNLTLSLAGIFTKYVYSSELRGTHPGDTSGCRPFQGGGVGTAGVGIAVGVRIRPLRWAGEHRLLHHQQRNGGTGQGEMEPGRHPPGRQRLPLPNPRQHRGDAGLERHRAFRLHLGDCLLGVLVHRPPRCQRGAFQLSAGAGFAIPAPEISLLRLLQARTPTTTPRPS